MKKPILKLAIPLVMFSLPASCLAAMQEPTLLPEKAIIDSSQQKPNSKVDLLPNSSTAIEDSYPAISKMEEVTFGKSKPSQLVEERLSALEQAVFCTTYKEQSLFDRTQKLKLTILGTHETVNNEADLLNAPMLTPLLSSPNQGNLLREPSPEVTYFELVAQDAASQNTLEQKDLENCALQLINSARTQLHFPPLVLDKLAMQMAEEHVADLCKRKVISHLNARGENPDLRYTASGGTGAVMESLISLKPEQVKERRYTKALVAGALKQLMDRQDDREAILSADATGLGFSMNFLPGEKRAVACFEVSTMHGAITPLPASIHVGDKIEVKGTVEQPYQFAKITLAWEGAGSANQNTEEVEEALPYFPPLDYVGYAHKSEHDYSAAMAAVRIGCIAGVIAGSVFMPPVALAAPLIAMSGGSGEPKPMSDIPIHGGVKLSGDYFSGKMPVSNGGKEGIYYITVWAKSMTSPNPIPISRRAYRIMDNEDVSSPKPIADLNRQI